MRKNVDQVPLGKQKSYNIFGGRSSRDSYRSPRRSSRNQFEIQQLILDSKFCPDFDDQLSPDENDIEMFRPKKVLLLFDDKRNDDPVGNQQSLSFQRPSSELLKKKLEPLLERSPRQEQTTKSQALQRQGTPDNP